jgi:hypothetical protein
MRKFHTTISDLFGGSTQFFFAAYAKPGSNKKGMTKMRIIVLFTYFAHFEAKVSG